MRKNLKKLFLTILTGLVASQMLTPVLAVAEPEDNAADRIEGENYVDGDNSVSDLGIDDDFGVDQGDLDNESTESSSYIELSEYEPEANSFRYKDGYLILPEGEGVSSQSVSWPSGAKYKGIDVSTHNGDINWAKVKAFGITFAIIRCGYGWGGKDSRWVENVKGALNAGLKVGVYLYSYAWDTTTAKQEAQWCLNRLSAAGITPSKLSLPVYYDLENEGTNGKPAGKDDSGSYHYVSNSTLVKMAKVWAEVIEGAGYDAGYYANLNWWNNYLKDSFFNSYERWVAQYNSSCSYSGSYSAWQYSSTEKVNGINGYVDMNFYYKEFGLDVTEFSKIDLSDGKYYINSVLSPTSSICIQDAGTENGKTLQLFKANGEGSQQFTLEQTSDGDGSFTIANVNSGLVLDVKNANAYSGAVVQQYVSNGSNAQKWYLRDSGAGWYIQSKLGNWVLDIASGKTSDGTSIRLYKPNGSSAQKFIFASVDSDNIQTGVSMEIESAGNTNLVFDIASASTKNGANVQLYSANNTDAQRFVFTKVSKNGVYSIKNVKSDKMVEVASGKTANKSSITQYDSNSTISQYWSVIDYGEYGCSFVGMKSGKAIDVPSASYKEGVKLQLYTYNASTAQRWMLARKSSTRETLDELASTNKNVLEEGIYTISALASPKLVLDVASGSLNNGANVQAYGLNDSSAQRWIISKDAKGYLVLTNEKSGKVLDVKNGSASNGANIQQYSSNGSYAQKWIAVEEDGFIKLVSALNKNYCLSFAGESIQNGSNVQLGTSTDTNAQGLIFSKQARLIEDGIYQISASKNSRYVLDVASGSKKNGGNVQIYVANNTKAQRWQVTNNADGSVTVTNIGSAKVLDVTSARTANKTNVQQYASNGSKAQKWYPSVDAQGRIMFHTALDRSKVLDVSGGKMANGINVQIYSGNGTTAQKWNVEAASE